MAKPTDSKQALGLAKGLSIDADYFAGDSVARSQGLIDYLARG